MKGFVLVSRLANHEGPRQRQPLLINVGDGPYEGAVMEVADGTLVRISHAGVLLSAETIDAPLHIAASKLLSIITNLNRGAAA